MKPKQRLVTQFIGKSCIIEEGKFPILYSMNPKTNGMLVGISGNGIIIGGEIDSKGRVIGGELEKQKNIANGYDPSTRSHEIFIHDKSEIEAIKAYKSQFKGKKLYTLYFQNADFGIGFNKPGKESTKVVNYMKGKHHHNDMNY